MNLQTIKSTLKAFGDILRNNSSTVLTAMAVVGSVTSVVMAIKATPKAIELMELDKEERAEALVNPDELKTTPIDYVRVCWRCYTPTALMTALSIGCIISAQTINLKRNAAMAALYSTAATSLKEYKDKTLEIVGTNKEQKIRDEIAKEHIEANPVSSREIVDTGHGEYLCYDTLSGRYFRHSIEGVRKVVNDLNKSILVNEYISLNEFYYSLGLKNIKLGDEMGWNVNHMIDVCFDTQQADDGSPCLVLDYTVGPRYDFEPF